MDNILWEDLDTTETRVQQIMNALHALQRAIESGWIDQPTRQDSKRLNRLTVLADLLYAEVSPLTDSLVQAAQPSGNGHRASAD